MNLPRFVSSRVAFFIIGTSLSTTLGGIPVYGQSPDANAVVSIIPRTRPQPLPEELPRSTFRLDVKLIQIPVTVSDFRDRPLLGLPQNAFRMFEDEAEQEIVSFDRSDGPLSTGLVFDVSGSMKSRIQDSRTAVEQFFATSMKGDEFSLVTFSDSPELVSPFTPDPGEISRRMTSLHPHGWTAMIDAIWLSLQEMKRATNTRKAVLVLSDGGDNNSRYSEGELLSLVREADVRIYAIGLFERPRFLEKLADETGGTVVWVRKLSELPEAMEKLSTEIRNEYRLGYFSNRPQNYGKYHKVRVEVQPPSEGKQLRVSWRRGYTAP
jgi:Ca-activated chloride channel family protein